MCKPEYLSNHLELKFYSISRCFSRNYAADIKNLRHRRSHWSRQIPTLFQRKFFSIISLGKSDASLASWVQLVGTLSKHENYVFCILGTESRTEHHLSTSHSFSTVGLHWPSGEFLPVLFRPRQQRFWGSCSTLLLFPRVWVTRVGAQGALLSTLG